MRVHWDGRLLVPKVLLATATTPEQDSCGNHSTWFIVFHYKLNCNKPKFKHKAKLEKTRKRCLEALDGTLGWMFSNCVESLYHHSVDALLAGKKNTAKAHSLTTQFPYWQLEMIHSQRQVSKTQLVSQCWHARVNTNLRTHAQKRPFLKIDQTWRPIKCLPTMRKRKACIPF